MTKRPVDERAGDPQPCRWCGRPLPPPAATGRPRAFCRQSCRQLEYETRRRSGALELGPDDVVVRKQSLDELRDDVYVLSCAVDDAERDLAELRRPSVSELQRIIADLIEASNALRRPSAVPH